MFKTKKYNTTFLFKRRNRLVGAGSIFNIAGNYFKYNYTKTGEERDRLAIANDWGVIGDDLKKAMDEVAKQINTCP
jgi:hypothetical protein